MAVRELLGQSLSLAVRLSFSCSLAQLRDGVCYMCGSRDLPLFEDAALSALDDAGQLSSYLRKGEELMQRMGYTSLMINEEPSARLNQTISRVVALSKPTLARSLLVKHPLCDPEVCDPELVATELPSKRRSSVVLSDPGEYRTTTISPAS